MSSAHTHPAWQAPLQWPEGNRRAADRRALALERLLKAAILACLLALTVFDRFGLRLTDSYSLQPALVATYALVFLALLAGAAQLNPRGVLAYLAVVSVAALSFLVNTNFGEQHVSIESLLLLVVVYAPFAIGLRPGNPARDFWRWIAKMYVGFAVFLAAAGIAQFLAQFMFQPYWLFDYKPLIPPALRASEGWNTVISNGVWVKSNGFFLREPSIFSLKLALALLLELGAARRKWVLLVLAAALVLTYSGSGLVVLAIALLFPFGRRSLYQVALAGALAALLFFALGDALKLSYTAARIQEFDSRDSSADCRFIQPGLLVIRNLDTDGWTSVLGHGPGTTTKTQKARYSCEPTYAKIPFEYGLLGVLAFAFLLLGALNRSVAPLRIRVALLAEWLLLGALLAPEALMVIYVLSAMWPQSPEPAVHTPA